MAHSTATMTAATAVAAHNASAALGTTGEINYFYKDENGKILKVLRPVDIKQEPHEESIGTGILYKNKNLGNGNVARVSAFNQLNSTNQGQFVRLQNSYNVPKTENTAYTIVKTQSVSGANMHDSISTTKGGAGGISERFVKYTPSPNIRMKSKLHAIHSTHSTPVGVSVCGGTAVSYTPTSSTVQKKRKPDKAGKGLRHFSMKVCEKVKEKGVTTYNEVADELVHEELQNSTFDTNCDQKNIRRRVYDALNVLMAMHIISKDKKEIRWIGLPTNSAEQFSVLEKEYQDRRERIQQKHQQLREVMLQQVAFKSLIERNKEAENQGIVPTQNSSIQLPFIIVNTYKTTKINCSVTNDKSEYIFKFDDKFEMHDDIEVLKRMGLLFGLDKGCCTVEEIERAKSLVPPNFAKYIEAYGRGETEVDIDINMVTEDTEKISQTDEATGSSFAGVVTHTANKNDSNDSTNVTMTIATGDTKLHDLEDDEEYSDID